MSSLTPIAVLLGGVLVLVAAAAAVLIGRDHLLTLRHDLRPRVREAAPYLAFLGAVLALNRVARDVGPEISWMFGWNITGLIYSIEGNFVALVQSVASPGLTVAFSFLYLYGYVFLLLFPFLLYVALSDLQYLKETTVAFGLNYGIGLVCYVLFISYGPRNLIPDLVEPFLYSTYPRSQIITSQVNSNTNVFPSLHASLSTTVALLSWRTRDINSRWTAIAVPLAAGIVVSTMYLGIHWATDVVAGILLGAGSVTAAIAIVERQVGDRAGVETEAPSLRRR